MSDQTRQNATQFEANPKMLKMLEAAISPDVEPNISAWAVAAGVDRSMWYRWQKIDGFIGWFNEEYRKSLEGVRTALVKVGLQKALAGDVQFWKVMMEKMGEIEGESKIIEIKCNIPQEWDDE